MTVRLPKVLPDYWEKSKFRISPARLWVSSFLAAVVAAIQIVIPSIRLGPSDFLVLPGMDAVAVLYALLRDASGKVNMQVSHEEK